MGGRCADLLAHSLCFIPLGRLLRALQVLGAETRDPDVLNIKAAGLKRVCGLLFMGRGGGKGGGWVTHCLQSQWPVNKFCIHFTFRQGFIP